MSESPERGKKKGRKVRVEMRKNRAKPGRDQGAWTRRLRENDPAAQDSQQVENVRAKGDLSRKRTVIEGGESVAEQLLSGLVTAVRGLIVEVDENGRRWACTVRGMLRTRSIESRAPVIVGDEVEFSPVLAGDQPSVFVSGDVEMPEGVIEKVAPRRTTLVRQYESKRQIVAANVDQVVIVSAANQPTLRPHLIDRYLVAIHQGEMRPIIVINKADLDEDGEAAEIAARYQGLGYKSLLVSVVDDRGIDELRALLTEKTSAIVGQSGVGKSSLINALQPGMKLAVGSLSDLQRGRHTTTTAQLLRWSFGGHVVDTPGLRQFDLGAVEKDELDGYFIEFVGLVSNCKFPGCSHIHETSCAIRDAVEAGEITPERYESYCKMYEEAAARPTY